MTAEPTPRPSRALESRIERAIRGVESAGLKPRKVVVEGTRIEVIVGEEEPSDFGDVSWSKK